MIFSALLSGGHKQKHNTQNLSLQGEDITTNKKITAIWKKLIMERVFSKWDFGNVPILLGLLPKIILFAQQKISYAYLNS